MGDLTVEIRDGAQTVVYGSNLTVEQAVEEVCCYLPVQPEIGDDEATVERVKRAVRAVLHGPRQPQPRGTFEEELARAAVAAARGGEQ